MPIVSPIIGRVVSPAVGRGAASASADSLLTDLVAWWSLDEASGTRVNAHNPGTHDLTDNNTVGSTTGVVGGAASFAGGGAIEYLSANHHSDFVIGDTPATIAGWAKFGAGSDSNGRIFCKSFSSSTGGEWQISRALEAARFGVRNSTDSGAVTTPDVAVTYDTFFFFIAWHDPDADVIGFEVNRGTPVTAALSGGTYVGTNFISIGGRSAASEIAGAVDEPAFWRRLLTTDEKDRLYNGGAGMAYPG